MPWTYRWWRDPEQTAAVAGALLLLILVAGVAVATGPPPPLVGLLAAAPFLAAAARWPAVLAIGIAAAVEAALLSTLPSGPSVPAAGVVAVILAVTATATASARAEFQRAQRLADLAQLTGVAQTAVLRPIGPHVGRFAIAVSDTPATTGDDPGGHLYEAFETPFGVRTILGDIPGTAKDSTLRTVSAVLGTYRQVAHERADLPAIVADLNRTLRRWATSTDRVTATLVEERGGTLTVASCGQPAPLLLRHGRIVALPPHDSPRLSGTTPTAAATFRIALEPGDRLLVFTNRLVRARRGGIPFPTAQRGQRLLSHGTVHDALASLDSAVIDWVSGRLDERLIMLVMEYAGAQPDDPGPTGPG